MNDSVKRVKPDTTFEPDPSDTLSVWELAEDEGAPYSPQMARLAMVPSHVVTEIWVPKGIKDFQQWSQTMVVLPKYKAKEWTFREIVVASGNDKEVAKYLKWIFGTYGKNLVKNGLYEPKSQAVDMAYYLGASNWLVKQERYGIEVQKGYTRTFKE